MCRRYRSKPSAATAFCKGPPFISIACPNVNQTSPDGHSRMAYAMRRGPDTRTEPGEPCTCVFRHHRHNARTRLSAVLFPPLLQSALGCLMTVHTHVVGVGGSRGFSRSRLQPASA